MITRLWKTVRHLPRPLIPRLAAPMSSFTIPGHKGITVTSVPDLSKDALLRFPAFNTWLSTLQRSLGRQQDARHEFHADPYVLRTIDIQAVDFFGGGRLGFVKMKADVSNSRGEGLPGSVFLRGGSVAMLVSFTHTRARIYIIPLYTECMLILSLSCNPTMYRTRLKMRNARF